MFKTPRAESTIQHKRVRNDEKNQSYKKKKKKKKKGKKKKRFSSTRTTGVRVRGGFCRHSFLLRTIMLCYVFMYPCFDKCPRCVSRGSHVFFFFFSFFILSSTKKKKKKEKEKEKADGRGRG